MSGIFSLLQCTDYIESHLASIHLSQENITEGKLILARAGLFDLDKLLVTEMSIYAKHRQPASIQHIKLILVGAREGQRAVMQ